MTSAHRSITLAAWAGLTLGLGLACGDDGGSGNSCVMGQQMACTCPSGANGLAPCVDGGFGACVCGDATTGGTGGTDGTDSGGSSDNESTGGACGNGMEDPGECSMGDPAYCPEDCTTGDTTTTGPGDCVEGGPVYATLVAPVASRWESGALVGYAAGQQMCREAATAAGVPGAGEVSVCDYVQLLQAELAGELVAVPAGTTAWLHRTTLADVMGMPSEAGVGGRCAEWTSLDNTTTDGEYVEFPVAGMVSYVLDDDTFYDGVDTTHTQPGALECGMQMRSILCCHPLCIP